MKTGLVLSDPENPEQDAINKTNQEDFKKNGTPDILVVHLMLTTGYDVKRLKKMYLLRAPRAHSLLQTISRVNRPYKNREIGKTYKYGYIVDFVDIEQEYSNSLQAYIKELEEDSNDGEDSDYTLAGLVIDKEDIQRKYKALLEELKVFNINTENLEIFSRQITMYNKETLLKIRKVLNGIKDCRVEFELSRADDYAKQIDKERINKLTQIVQLRIDLINLKNRPYDILKIMNNDEVMDVLYQFFKVDTGVMNLSDLDASNEDVNKLKDTINRLQDEINKNKNQKDRRIRKLEDLLKDVFERLNIDNIKDLTEELQQAIEEIKNVNEENEKLAREYGNHYSFVKTYSDSIESYKIEKSDAEQLIKEIYKYLEDKLLGDTITIQGKENFVKAVQKEITPKLYKSGLYKKVKEEMSQIIGDLYTNIQLFK